MNKARVLKALQDSTPIFRVIGFVLAVGLAGIGQRHMAQLHLQQGLYYYLAAGLLSLVVLEYRRKKHLCCQKVMPSWLEALILLSIMGVATWVRLHRILEIPAGHFVDECHQAYEGVRVLRGELKGAFRTGWYQVPTLYFYYVALFFRVLGISVWVMKFSTVFSAVLTILPLYFIARQWFGKGVGLALAGLLATNRWHLTMSRWGMVEVLPPLLGTAAIYFMVRGISKGTGFPLAWRFVGKTPEAEAKDREDAQLLLPSISTRLGLFFLSGAMLALGLYTYLAARLFPPVCATFMLLVILTRKRSIRSYLLPCIALMLAFCIVFGPLALHFKKYPNEFSNRTNEISIFHDSEGQFVWEPVWTSVQKHMLMFNYRGDINGRHNLPGEPMFSHGLSLVFILGLFLCVGRLDQPWRVLLLIAFAFTIAGGAFSSLREAPQAFRTLTAVPIAILIAGVFLDSARRFLKETIPCSNRRLAVSCHVAGWLVLVGLVAWSSVQDLDTYFRRQGLSPEVTVHYNMEATFVARRLTEMKQDDTVYLFEGYQANSICQFLNHDATNHYRFKRIIHLPLFPYEQGDIYIFGPPRWDYLENVLKLFYPNATMRRGVDSTNGTLMYLEFRVPKEDWNRVAGARWEVQDASDGSVLSMPVVSQMGVTPDFAQEALSKYAGRAFNYRFSASLFCRQYREYNFSVQKQGGNPEHTSEIVSASFDGAQHISRFNQNYAARFLPGWISVEFTVNNADPTAGYFLCWDGEVGHPQPISRRMLCSMERLPYGLLGKYYARGGSWDGDPISIRQDLFIEAMQEIPYSVEWKGRLVVTRTGVHQFTLKADDGATVWIGDKQIMSMDEPTGMQAASIHLEPGEHPIRIRYFDYGGGQYLEIQWMMPGGNMRQFDYTDLLPPVDEK